MSNSIPLQFTFGLDSADDADRGWIWHGLLAPGKLTMLTSLWKSGKSTLLAHLLAQRQLGGAAVRGQQQVVVLDHQVVHRDGGQVELQRARVCARKHEQLIDQPDQPFSLAPHRCEQRAAPFGVVQRAIF